MNFSYLKLAPLILLLIFSETLFSQVMNDIEVDQGKLNLSRFDTQKDYYNDTKYDGHFYVTVKFDKIPSTKRIAQSEIKLLSYQGNNTYSVAIPSYSSKNSLSKMGINFIDKPTKSKKISDVLLEKRYPEWMISQKGKIDIAVIFHDHLSEEKIDRLINAYNGEILKKIDKNKIVTIRIEEEKLLKIAAFPLVAYIDAIESPLLPLNHESEIISKANVVHSNLPGGKNLRGSGVVIGVGDGGQLGDHIDFEGRVINKADGTYSIYGFHGDHVSGTVGGAGNLNPRHKGLAPEATILTQQTMDVVYNAEEYVEDFNMVITNNSYGPGPDCTSNGTYSYASVFLDKQQREIPQLLHLYAAGNSGSDTCGDFPQGFKTILRNYGSAKNVLTVGAVDEKRKIGNLSSRGPVNDGRIKPEICGVGMKVTSTGREYDYHQISGTSMATPAVAASIGLMYEKYRQLNNNENPLGVLMKSIACNTADDLGNKGPDYVYGFGLMNVRRAIEVVEQEQYMVAEIANEEENIFTIEVPEGLSELKIMLNWNDKEAESGVFKTLVNNLDLQVINPYNNTYTPWKLNHESDKVDDLAVRGIDDLNNVEQVTIDNPVAGTYQIKIKGTEIPFGPQSFCVSYDLVKPELILTHPFGQERFIPNQNELILWEAERANTSPFKVEYSADSGNNWTVLADNIAADKRHLIWELDENVAVTNTGKIRVSRANGAEVSMNQQDFSILHRPENMTASAICDGYIKLRWDEVPNAKHYEIQTLVEGAMYPIDVTDDREYIIEENFEAGKKYWFSVVAINDQGHKSERSIASSCVATDNGSCPWGADGKIIYHVPQEDGRHLTSLSIDMNQIDIDIKNIGNNAIGDLEVAYRINDGQPIMERYQPSIQSGNQAAYTFNQTHDFTIPGEYYVDTWINHEEDVRNQNDSVIGQYKITQLSNEPVTLPYVENFEAAKIKTYTDSKIGLEGMTKWDFDNQKNAKMVVKDDHSKYISLKPNDSGLVAETATNAMLTLNMVNYDLEQPIYLTFDYKLKKFSDDNKVWVRGNDTKAWIEVSQLERATDFEESEPIDIADLLKSYNQTLTTSFQIMFAQVGAEAVQIDNVRLSHEAKIPAFTLFTAINANNEVVLDWELENPSDEGNFLIEVAEESNSQINLFQAIGSLKADADKMEYQFVENATNKTGIQKYRITYEDDKGNNLQSEIRSINFDEEMKVVLFPNPFINEIQISFNSLNDESGHFILTDIAGNLIMEFDEKIKAGMNNFTIGLDERLPEGVYLVHIEMSDSSTTHKISKANN